ncbi:cell adhesion molecule Dscam1-like [Parasteatoda tepidariorum]|uniref:cell adhesion molecule Dscam1-like n=1 Tax=Parasteatoda tepidariorum TaxID=114398 RepID=UPI0039BCA525
MCLRILLKSLLCLQRWKKLVMFIRIFNILVIYRCIMRSYADETLLRGPSFTIEPPNKIEFSNTTGTMVPCAADGLPHPVITWKKGSGESLQDLPGLRYARHDGTLVFPPFSGEEYRPDIHATVYRCEASNTGGIVGSRDVHIRAVVMQVYEIQLFDEFVLRGNIAVLHCPVPSYVSDYVKVASWERMDGFIITPNIISGKYGMLDNGDLYIKDSSEHDNTYQFRCQVENSITKDKHVSRNYARVIVTEPHHNEAPRIIRRFNRVSSRVGQRVTLPCISQGHPVPNHRWRKQFGDELTLTGLGPLVRQENGILIFEKIKSSHAGKYVCYVSNTMGEDKMETELIVEEDITATIFPKIARTDIGKNATFNCSIIGGPVDSVIWKKDMKFVSSNIRISYPTPTILHLTRAVRQDAGMYQCFATRDVFGNQASAQLIIGDVAPKFKMTFPEKIVRSGSFVSLMCVATGNPVPQVKWSMDNIWPLSTRPGVLVSTYLSNHGEVFSYVNITSLDITDSGLYSCEALNDAGRTVHSRRLNVFGSLFIRPLNNLSALSGEEFSVLCPFGGYPFDSIIWKKEGRLLPVNQRQQVFPNGTLKISEMQPGTDDGIYSCEVLYNQGIPAIRTFSIVIRTKPNIGQFSFPGNLHEGMRTAVTCIVVAGDPPITTRWLKDGLPLIEEEFDADIYYGGNGFVSTLTLNTLAFKHNGEYACMATNDVGSGSFSTRLTVKVPPRWILQPRDTSAIAGHSAKIDCQADGVPQPHVRWKVNSNASPENFKTIVSSSHVHILVNGSLNFRNVEKSDEGSYLCEANNGVGTGLSTVVRFTVHSSPKFETKFSTLTVRRGEKVKLNCISSGDIPMTFTWRKNGVIIDLLSKPRYSQQLQNIRGGESVDLIIEKAEREDSASFTCTAMNDFGEDSMNFQLTVQEQISAEPLTVPGDETAVIIRGLNPKTRYFFRVKCENALGDSQYGAEVAITTLEEPPREATIGVKAIPVSSRAVNVSWQRPIRSDGGGSVDGFYVGFKTKGSSETYTFKSVVMTEDITQHYVLYNLNRNTEYIIIVQPFNSRGAGPPSEEKEIRTMEFDAPGMPAIKSYYTTSKTVKLSWEISVTSNAPVSGYILYKRMEGSMWQEIKLKGGHKEYLFQDLQCGTKYYCYVIAFNSAGKGNSSETISVKTDGNAPIAADKRLLLNLNYTTLFINLNSWHNGGCPIRFFIVQYKANGQQDWTLVSNNIIPEQQNITIMDLIPGTWYTLLMTARNDAGSTDAEYIFATMTASGEYPPRPSEMGEAGSLFYKHLLITVPIVSSAIVLIVVLCVVYFITRRRSSDRRTLSSDVAEGSDPIKPESLPLSSTYETAQEPAYFPTPYAASRVTGYSRESCVHPCKGSQQNMGTFGSTRSGYTYDIPYPPRKMEKSEKTYASPILYCPPYAKDINFHPRISVVESRRQRRSLSWRGVDDSPSSGESDDGQILQTKENLFVKEESRESETECDRIWKSLEECKYEANKRWVEHAVSILS